MTEPPVRNVSFGDRVRKPYPAYKDSGIEWLGQIPAHWEVYPLRRRLFREEASIKIGPFGSQLKLEFMTQEGFKVYGQEHVIARDFRRGHKYVDHAKFAELAACEIQSNDLVVTMMGSSGRCAVVPKGIERGIMDSHLLRIRLPDCDLDSKYLCLLIDESAYVRDQIKAGGKGAIMHGLNSGIIKSIVLAVPPSMEQRRILAFLDRETAKIDALVEKKERLIELLQEKRTALITHAVIKGLDPNVPMKDSGIDWLGEIPAHWKARRAKHILGEVDERSEKDEGELLTVSHITGVTRRSEKQDVYMFMAETLEGYKICQPGDLVINTMWAWMGAMGCSLTEGLVSPSYNVYRFGNERFLPKYYDLLVRTPEFISEVNRWSKGIWKSRLRLYPEALFEIMLPIPPLQEQRQIVSSLDRETAKIDALTSKIQEAIERLKEYRIALISAAVTGKIDVRRPVKYGEMGSEGHASGLSMRG